MAEFDQFAARKNSLIPEAYCNISSKTGDLGTKDSTAKFTQEKMAFAQGFVDVCRRLTDQIGQDLKLGLGEVSGESQSATEVELEALNETVEDVTVLDLRGVMCPLNYVKTKLKLEMMDDGERLEVWLDAGDPIKNVPMSLRNDGHKVITEDPLEADEQHFKVLVEKVEV